MDAALTVPSEGAKGSCREKMSNTDSMLHSWFMAKNGNCLICNTNQDLFQKNINVFGPTV